MEKIIQNQLLYPEILWERPVHSYKIRAGKILVLAGSKGSHGAATLTCETIFRSGTGVLTLGFPDALKNIFKDIIPPAMMSPLPSTYSGSLSKLAEEEIIELSKANDVAVIGPGLSENAVTTQLIWQVIFRLAIPVVLDDDGTSALIKGIEVIRSKQEEQFLIEYFAMIKIPLIIILSSSQAAKLINACKLKNQKKVSSEFVEKHSGEIIDVITNTLNIGVVLISDNITLGYQDKIIVTRTAIKSNHDVLAGAIGSFIGQNPQKILEASATAIYLYNQATEIAKKMIGKRPVGASDIIRFLPQAIKESEE